MNGLSLCSGVAGLELGLHLALGDSYRTVCYVEREAHAAAVLVARMEEGILAPAPIWDDLGTFDGRRWRGVVDLVSAGYPCQPFSSASRGRRAAIDLWPEVFRIIRECEPEWVFLENVPQGLNGAWLDLRRAGWCVVGPGELSAAAVGAPHIRRRHWLLAHSYGRGEPLLPFNAEAPGCAAEWWQSEPDEVGMDDGTTNRMDRLRACGNGVVPLCAAYAFRMLARELWQIEQK